MRMARNIRYMTTHLTLIDSRRDGESFDEAIARRLLGEFGQLRLSKAAVARRIGMSQSQFSRRMTGELSFTTAEIAHLCDEIRLDRDYILTGARTLREPPPGSPIGHPSGPTGKPVGYRTRHRTPAQILDLAAAG